MFTKTLLLNSPWTTVHTPLLMLLVEEHSDIFWNICHWHDNNLPQLACLLWKAFQASKAMPWKRKCVASWGVWPCSKSLRQPHPLGRHRIILCLMQMDWKLVSCNPGAGFQRGGIIESGKDHCLLNEILPSIQFKLPTVQPEAAALHPNTSEETEISCLLIAASCQLTREQGSLSLPFSRLQTSLKPKQEFLWSITKNSVSLQDIKWCLHFGFLVMAATPFSPSTGGHCSIRKERASLGPSRK